MSIPINLEEIGFNEATVKIDIDALSRDAMIRLFNIRDEANQLMNKYSDDYIKTGLPNVDNPGATSLFKEFIKLEGKLLGFISQEFLYIIKPIQVALELPNLITKPKELAVKIKEIVNNVKDLINDIIEFLTETKDWIIKQIMGPFADINIPIPEIEINILGITIKTPEIDNLNLFKDETWEIDGKINPYKEFLTEDLNNVKSELNEILTLRKKLQDELTSATNNKIVDIKSKIYDLNEKEEELKNKLYTHSEEKINEIKQIKSELENLRKQGQDLRNKLNPDLNDTQMLILSTVTATSSLIYSSLLQESTDYFDIMMDIHDLVMEKQKLMVKILDKRKIQYNSIDKTKKLKELSNDALDFVVENNLNTPTNTDILYTFTDTVSEMIDDEEEYIMSYINDFRLKTNATFNKKLDIIDKKIYDLYQDSLIEKEKIKNSKEEIIKDKETTDKLKTSLKILTSGAVASISSLQIIKNKKKELMDRLSLLSPASAWVETQKELIVGVIKAPIDFVINLIKKLFEGVVEFLKEIPIPRFTKLREFFSDLLKLPEENNIVDIINEIIDIPENIINTVSNVLRILPMVIINVIKEFILGIIKPNLPIPVTI